MCKSHKPSETAMSSLNSRPRFSRARQVLRMPLHWFKMTNLVRSYSNQQCLRSTRSLRVPVEASLTSLRCEIDFSKGLANEEATDADAVAAYEKISHENKIKRESRNRISSTRQECKSLCLLISPFPTPSCLLQGMFLRVILWGRISLGVYLVHFSEWVSRSRF